jgi:hypothetical protein
LFTREMWIKTTEGLERMLKHEVLTVSRANGIPSRDSHTLQVGVQMVQSL